MTFIFEPKEPEGISEDDRLRQAAMYMALMPMVESDAERRLRERVEAELPMWAETWAALGELAVMQPELRVPWWRRALEACRWMSWV